MVRPPHLSQRFWHRRTLFFLFLAFAVLDLLIYEMEPRIRERVLLWTTLLFFVWPFLGLFVSYRFILLLPCLPLFGIWLGFRYCGDMGSHGHMFLALFPLVAGIWGVLIGVVFAWHRSWYA